MKKVLIVAYNDLNNSGVPNVIYQTIKALHNEYCFDVLIFGDNDYYYQKLHSEQININLIKYIDRKPKNKVSRLFWWFCKMPHNHYIFITQLLKNCDYSIVHSFKEYYSWPFLKAAKKAGIEKRILHRNINPEKPQKLINKVLEFRNRRLTLKYSTLLVGVSESCCKNAFKNNKYIVLYNSYDEKKYNMGVDYKLSDNELVITQVASYNHNKNQEFSLCVLKELKKLHPNVRLNLVGATEIDSYYQSLIRYAKDNNLENNVSFIERNDNVNKIYENTTFTLLPSYSEGLPLNIIEAQACGITIFASSSVTKEVDRGGVIFIELSKGASIWANEIYKIFKKHKCRSNYSVEDFCFTEFKKQLENIYR